MKGYTLVPVEDTDTCSNNSGLFDFNSHFQYNVGTCINSEPTNYRSIYTYNSASTTINVGQLTGVQKDTNETFLSRACHYFLVCCCYILIIVTAPCSAWFCVKKLFQYERLIVFRLGRLQSVKGPGLTIIIPWIDEWKTVDLRMRAFIIPPQQLILTDGAIVEVGCEICFHISDVIKSVLHVKNLDGSVRLLGQTLLTTILQQKTLTEINSERALIHSKLQVDLNASTLAWGLEVSKVEMSPIKVLDNGNGKPSPLASLMSSLQNVIMPGISMAKINQKNCVASERTSKDVNSVYSVMVNKVFPHIVENSTGAIYKLQVTGDLGGTFWLDTKNGKTLAGDNSTDWQTPDVSVKVSAANFLDIASGSVTPLQAYIGGNIEVTGNTYLLYDLQDVLQKCGYQQSLEII